MKRGQYNLNPEQREQAGIIVTLARGKERQTMHLAPGKRGELLRELAARCDGGGWSVLTISTPETIFRDLLVTRRRPKAQSPEWSMLRAIERQDLLA